MKIFTKKHIATLSVLSIFGLSAIAYAIAQPSTPLPRDENRVPMQRTYMNTLASGRKVSTTVGTAVTLIGTTRPNCKRITITALNTNTNLVYVGGSTTLATVGAELGISLSGGDAFTLGVDDCNDIYLDVITSGEGVTFVYQE